MQGLIFIILSFFVYSLILKIDVGQLDFFMFKKEKNLYELPLFFYVLDSIVLAILAFLSKTLYTKKIKFILKFCIVIPFLLTIVLITKVINMEPLQIIDDTAKLSIQEFERHQLSKNGTNVIFILADMFNGNYMQRILDEEPEYKAKLDGFVWYPDCLSISDETLRSLPGLLGGHSAVKKSLNYIDDIIEQDYKDAIGETCNDLFNALRSNEFEITVSNQSDIKYADLSFVTIDKFWLHENEWRKRNNYERKINQSDKVKLYVLLGVFQSLPHYLKSILYDERGWLFFRESSAITAQTGLCISSVVQLDTLSDRNIVVNDKKNTFLFLHSLLPHYPWGINHDGNIVSADDDFTDTFSISFTEKFAYYSAKKTISLLIKYIDWLKQNGIYNNSVIYVFSDHGNDRKDSGIPVSKAVTYPDAEDNISWAHTLLLVKDKYKTGMIEINPLYVSSADIPSMLLTGLNINFLNDIDPRKVTIEENKNRTRLFFAPSRTENKKNLYYVKGSIFDPNSWSVTPPKEAEK
ncbi:LTA synthase family protein [Treponema putidum]|nr:LTA synthase family protein [Treponema putidum]